MADDAAARIRLLVDAARAQKRAVGGSRGTTGPLGELYACELLHLDRAVDGTPGYDAKDAKGLRVQIKSRAPEKGDHVNPIGTVGRITSWEFDYTLLVLLDGAYSVDAMWRASPHDLAALQAKVRNPARGVSVRDFMRVGRRINVAPKQFGGAGLEPTPTDGESSGGPLTPPHQADMPPVIRRGPHPILDTWTGIEYHSKAAAGKKLAAKEGWDPNNNFVWFKFPPKYPDRFRTKNPKGEWVRLDDQTAPDGTTTPGKGELS